MNTGKTTEEGFSLIEVVVGLSIVLALFLAITQYLEVSTRSSGQALHKAQGSYLAEEGIEAVKFLREESWANEISSLATSTPHYLSFEAGEWEATSTPETVFNKFDRRFILENVYRDGNGNIAGSGTLDEGTKKLTVTVSWQERSGTTTEQLATYIMDLYND